MVHKSEVIMDFIVNVKFKGKHPWFGQGWPIGYTIDGIEGPPIELKVGKMYKFMIRTPSHPFYITSDEFGASGFAKGNIGPKPTDSGIYIFTPTKTGDFFYQCDHHFQMGGIVHVID